MVYAGIDEFMTGGDDSESAFNDIPKNLIVLGDAENGTIILMH